MKCVGEGFLLNGKKWICICVALLLIAAVAGCEKEAPQQSLIPAPTLAPDDSLSIAGTVELTLSENNEYTVTCTSDIPEGAFVTIYLMDDMGYMLEVNPDVIQRDGRCTASFDAQNANDTATENGAQAVVARVEFYPSSSGQPIEIQERFGSKGSKLAGDNVIMDDTTGEMGVRMESTEKELT